MNPDIAIAATGFVALGSLLCYLLARYGGRASHNLMLVLALTQITA